MTWRNNGLSIALLTLFTVTTAGQAVAGWIDRNESEQQHGGHPTGYVLSARFWFESMQNWQSEFLSLAAMVIGTIFLRQRGFAESKPVFAPHDETGKA